MEYPAADPIAHSASRRREAPHPHVLRVLAGEFVAGADYSTWRVRGTDDWLLLYTVAGSGRIAGHGRTLLTAAGDAVLIRPHTPHDYATAGDGWSLAFAHFHPRPEWSTLLDWPRHADGIGSLTTTLDVRPRVVGALRASARSSSGALAQSELFAVNALETALLWLDTQNPSRGGMDERLLRVVEHIAGDLAGDLSVASLARLAHLSPSRLSHLFSETLGLAPQRYVERERLTRAAQFLGSTRRAVGDIARDVGIEDPLYFTRRFRLLHGMSPTEYRDRLVARDA